MKDVDSAGQRAFKELPFWRQMLLLAHPTNATTWIRSVDQQQLIQQFAAELAAANARICELEGQLAEGSRHLDGCAEVSMHYRESALGQERWECGNCRASSWRVAILNRSSEVTQ